MDSNEFEELFSQAKQVGKLLAVLYRDVVGEELDVEGAIRHYPLIAIGLAAGAGTLGGWWLARRSAPQQLPPPRQASTLDRLEELLPVRLDRVREYLPEEAIEEAGDRARVWIDSVLEPKIKEVSSGRFGSIIRLAIERLDIEHPDAEDGTAR